jgi:hypothetical protein
LAPRDASLRANLQFVRSKVYSDEHARLPFWKNLIRMATLNEWTVLTAVLTWAFFVVRACGEWTGRRYTKTSLSFFSIALMCGLALGGAWIDRTSFSAVVAAKEATARFGPLDESQPAFQLRDGAELTVLTSKNSWLQVRDPEKRTGWIRRDEVVVVNAHPHS